MVRSCIDRKITKKKTAKWEKTQVYNHKLHHNAARHVGHNVKDFLFFLKSVTHCSISWENWEKEQTIEKYKHSAATDFDYKNAAVTKETGNLHLFMSLFFPG